jgi:hypothetical protein
MLGFILGVIVGVVINSVGFTGVARMVDKSVDSVRSYSQEAAK